MTVSIGGVLREDGEDKFVQGFASWLSFRLPVSLEESAVNPPYLGFKSHNRPGFFRLIDSK